MGAGQGSCRTRLENGEITHAHVLKKKMPIIWTSRYVEGKYNALFVKFPQSRGFE